MWIREWKQLSRLYWSQGVLPLPGTLSVCVRSLRHPAPGTGPGERYAPLSAWVEDLIFSWEIQSKDGYRKQAKNRSRTWQELSLSQKFICAAKACMGINNNIMCSSEIHAYRDILEPTSPPNMKYVFNTSHFLSNAMPLLAGRHNFLTPPKNHFKSHTHINQFYDVTMP